MLDSISPEQFDEWIAYRSIELDPVDRIIETLKLGFCALCRTWGAKVEPKDFSLDGEDEQGQTVSPRQASSMMRQHYGKR